MFWALARCLGNESAGTFSAMTTTKPTAIGNSPVMQSFLPRHRWEFFVIRVPIRIVFSVLDTHLHGLAANIPNFKPRHFRYSQSASIEQRQHCLMLEIGG